MIFSFVFREVFSGLRRNLSMVVSVVLVTFVSLLFVGLSSLLQLQISSMKGYWYDKVEVTIFLCNDFSRSANCAAGGVSDVQIKSIENRLVNDSNISGYVEGFYFETQEEAYEHFVAQFPNSPILDSLYPQQLPQSFRVKLYDPTTYEVISESFSNVAGVESVNDQRKVLAPLFTIINGVSVSAVVVAVIILVSAVLLITTTIRLSAFSRRREIGIMRLVGASKTFIQLPFVLEGVFAAFLGSLLAVGVLWFSVWFFVEDWLAVRYTQTSFVTSGDMFFVAPLLLGLGVVLAAVSSVFAIRRYMKV